jgi:hypothetical protein
MNNEEEQTPTKVYCLPKEKEHIEAQAKGAGM